MVVLNPAAEDYDAFIEHLAVDHRARRAYWHLRLTGRAATPALRRGLTHQDPRIRLECVIILDHLLDHESLADVIDRLDDPHPAVVAHALHALACDRCKQGSCRPGESHFVAKAIELLDVHPSSAVRYAAVDALGKVVHHRLGAIAVLQRAATDDHDRGVRKAAKLRLPGGSIYERTRPRQRRLKAAVDRGASAVPG
jgi:HEAT repeat protein